MEHLWLGTLEDRAREKLTPALFEYVVQGARSGVTAAEAVAAWQAVRLRPRVLRDVSDVDLGCDFLGTRGAVPWGVAPTTLQRAVHPEGELAMARAAAAAGVLMVVSSNAGTPFADIGATGVEWWLQSYLPVDRALAEPMLARAVDAGARAIVLTVDTPVVGTKHPRGGDVIWDHVDPGLLRVNFDPGYESAPGSEKAMDLSPADLDWLSSTTGLPVVVKGVVRPDDASDCVRAGAAAVWVSNHGGRQLDRTASTAVCLPQVVAAVAGAVPVFVDGGLRSGLDILAALALGADAVFLGRTPLLALAGGEADVARMHDVLRDELVEAFRLAGCRAVVDARGLADEDGATPR